MRELKGNIRWVVMIVAVFTSLFHLYTAGFGNFEPRIQRAVHIDPSSSFLFSALSSKQKVAQRSTKLP